MQNKIAIKALVNFILNTLTFFYTYKVINQSEEATIFYFLLGLSATAVNTFTIPLSNFYLNILSGNRKNSYEKFNNLLAITIGLIISAIGIIAAAALNKFKFSAEIIVIIAAISLVSMANIANNFYYAKFLYKNKLNFYENLTIISNIISVTSIVCASGIDNINLYVAVCGGLVKAIIILVASSIIHEFNGINPSAEEAKIILNEIKGLVTYASISRMSEVFENFIILNFGFSISSFALSKQITGAISMVIDRSIIKMASSEYFSGSIVTVSNKYRIQILILSIFMLLLLVFVLQIDLIINYMAFLLKSSSRNIELAIIGCVGLLISNFFRYNIEFIAFYFAKIGRLSLIYKFSILIEILSLPMKLFLSYYFDFIGFLFSICIESLMIYLLCKYNGKKYENN